MMTGKTWIRVIFLLCSFYVCKPALAQDSPPCLPDAQLTPGAAGDLTTADVCNPEYDNPAYKIPIALKGQVFTRYGINRYAVGYNVDHLIPPTLGGSNSIKNLWPQPLSGEWGWHRKNRLERRLRKLVCSRRLSLRQAQHEITADWIGAYKKYIDGPRQAQSDQP